MSLSDEERFALVSYRLEKAHNTMDTLIKEKNNKTNIQ